MLRYLTHLFDTFIAPLKDFRFLGWTLLILALAEHFDPQGKKIIGVILYVVFFWLLALAIRKIIFPYRCPNGQYLKISRFFESALFDKNIAAALVACGLIIFMCTVAVTFVIWMR